MKSKKNQRAVLAVALLGALALPIGVSASAGLDSGQFNIRAVNTGDVSIYADAGPAIGTVSPPVSDKDKAEAEQQSESWARCKTSPMAGKTGYERIAYSSSANRFLSYNGVQTGFSAASGCSWSIFSTVNTNGAKVGDIAGGPQGFLSASSDTATNTPFATSANGAGGWYAPNKSNGNSSTGTALTGFGMRFVESTPDSYVGVNESGSTPKLTVSKKERNAANTADVISGTWNAVMGVPGRTTALASSQSSTIVVVATEASGGSTITGLSTYSPSKQQLNVLPGSWSAVTWGTDGFFAISKDGKSVATSADGFTWKTAKSNIGPGWTSVAMGKISDSERFFVATKGTDTIATSKDGTNWLVYKVKFPADENVTNAKFTDAVFGAGKIVVIGSSSYGMEIQVVDLSGIYAK